VDPMRFKFKRSWDVKYHASVQLKVSKDHQFKMEILGIDILETKGVIGIKKCQ
jgi:hypothetical protein